MPRRLPIPVLVVTLVTLAACKTDHSGPAPSTQEPSATGTASASAPPRDAFCLVDLPGAWKAALTSGHIAHATDDRLDIKAVAEDGRSLFADSKRGSVRELVWLRGDQRTTVMRLADISQQVFGAAFDGRWLVFSVWDRPELTTSWTMYTWDSTIGGAPRSIGRATREGVFPFPIVHQGRAVWMLPVDLHVNQVHLTDLGTGRDTVIGSGWTEYPFRFGDLAVWPDVAVQDRAVELKAVSLTSGGPATLPVELRTPLSAPMYVSGDADTFVWSANDLSTLRAWRSDTPGPITIIAQARQGEYLQWPNVAGPIVTWDNGSAWFVADLRSGSYAQITPESGATTLTGDALVVTYAPTGTKELPMLDSTLIRPSHLPPLPACP